MMSGITVSNMIATSIKPTDRTMTSPKWNEFPHWTIGIKLWSTYRRIFLSVFFTDDRAGGSYVDDKTQVH